MADAVLIDIVARVARSTGTRTDVLFLDTGYHFAETLVMRDAVAATYRGRSTWSRSSRSSRWPSRTPPRAGTSSPRTPTGAAPCARWRRWTRRSRRYDAWVTGLRRDDSIARSSTPVVDWDRRNGKVKVNPLARWTQADVDDYVGRHGILVNPLLSDGFASVGCFPCTRRTTG